MISQESLADFLDKYELSGYGGFYLMDLGELIQDVEIEKITKSREATYEEISLNENLKVVNEGDNFRYVFFAGVLQGTC